MEQGIAGRLGRLNSYQVAGLAILTSAVAAGTVLVLMRRFVLRAPHDDAQSAPARDAAQQADVPTHFSEDLIIPGKTATGPEIEEQDAREGRSPEGV